MPTTRSFSIYLLKPGFDRSNSLDEDHQLEEELGVPGLLPGSSVLVLDSAPRPPWWKSYFAIQRDLQQVTKGALVFIPSGERTFALSFGHVSHNLNDIGYEHDFGLRVTLNSLDPKKLRSTDVLEPSASRRQRTQLPTESELTLFDFDRDSTILRRLTGKVKDEQRHLFKHATGASNLRISTAVAADRLTGLCSELLQLYKSDAFEATFPNLQNISPVRDSDGAYRIERVAC